MTPLTSPTYFCTSSEPMTLMKQASVLLATARAHRVLPVPGGPNSSTPLGGSMPRFTNLSGWGQRHKRTGQLWVQTGECELAAWTHVEQRGLHHFPQLLDLLFTPAHVAVGHVRLLLHLQDRKCYYTVQWNITLQLLILEEHWPSSISAQCPLSSSLDEHINITLSLQF